MREAESLIKRAGRYLRSARLLLSEEDYESSVSRSYYGMFYCTEAVLLTKDLSFSSHKGVISGFGEHLVKTGIFPKEMGRELNRAFEKRQLGDYEYTFVICGQEAEQVLKNAKDFMGKAVEYLKDKGYILNKEKKNNSEK